VPDRPVLDILTALFAGLDRADIRYCHWKSNEHLEASLRGATDLDLLVDRRQVQQLTRLLVELNCKRFLVKPGRGYPGIEDYVAFDCPTGALSHLHIHYQLTLGEPFLKGFRLPWEDLALATRVRDAASGVWVADPHVELLILVVRSALKLRTRDALKVMVGRRWARGDMLRELLWLKQRVDVARLAAIADPLIGADATGELLALVQEPRPQAARLRTIRRAARPSLELYRLYPPADARRRRWRGELDVAWGVARDLVRGGHRVSSRTAPNGGLAVACVGAPGAGATTVARELARWLAHDVASRYVPGDADDAAVLRQLTRHRGLGFVALTDRLPAAPDTLAPDLVIRLHVSPGVAARRRPGADAAGSARAAEAVRALAPAGAGRVVDVEADAPLDEVLLNAKRAVWEAL